MSRPLLRSVLELRPAASSSPAARLAPAAAASLLRPRRCFNTTAPVADLPPSSTPASAASATKTLDPSPKPKQAAWLPKKQQYQRGQQQQQQPQKSQQRSPLQKSRQKGQTPPTEGQEGASPTGRKERPPRTSFKHKHPYVRNPPRPGPEFGPPTLPPPRTPHASVTALLPVLAAQPSRYITVHIFDRPYLVTAGDQVRLPFLMQGVLPGDVLRLNRASVLGSRDYTLRGAPFIDERLYECRAMVLGVESEPLRIKLKTKQRNRREKKVKSKHKYTLLRISEVKVVLPEEGEDEAGDGAEVGTDEVVKTQQVPAPPAPGGVTAAVAAAA